MVLYWEQHTMNSSQALVFLFHNRLPTLFSVSNSSPIPFPNFLLQPSCQPRNFICSLVLLWAFNSLRDFFPPKVEEIRSLHPYVLEAENLERLESGRERSTLSVLQFSPRQCVGESPKYLELISLIPFALLIQFRGRLPFIWERFCMPMGPQIWYTD